MIVTGARGFLGSHLVRRLVAEGVEVHAVSRRPWPGSVEGFRTWSVDLREPDECRQLIQAVGPSTIFHLASHVAGGRDVALVSTTLADNLMSSVNLMAAVTDHKDVRIVLAGSMEEPHPAEKMTTPSSPYAASKWAATAYARMFHELWGVPTVVLRIAMAYGPGQPDERKLVPYVITRLLAGESPALSSGDREIDWVFVDDLIDSFLAAAVVPRAAGGIFDIGSGAPVSIRHTAQLIQEIIGTDVPLRFGAQQDRLLDSARIAVPFDAAATLGWIPQIGLRDGLSRTVEWYRARR